ncbi:hypothetical protein TREMEDRAFT_34170 [Tremella mesenterica DSM 1558]|uniref:uncharacterized protein n=1 Tax=Tremella mesenterica (strain ATCC 24925 / CBS 8224 / DSM 1558 / NBRC 9311 / NRRL Y-6157 / RJB 2259-6 / UBC 559-6) TaxID=578456 RepID=UPI0003F48C34|nr:uncharacterized protein TREMEDRAFT_34170 [Tremella mesenterica DSM 1558]EIW67034.1 hypothetical protein TREMEDRAFT_34170 [Tremella mesenterica DSM 1558]
MTTVNVADGWETPKAGPSKGTIAVDMDDVLSQTNATIVEMHNAFYDVQPPITLDDFKKYLYWNNRGWGTPQETIRMVKELEAAGLYARSLPVKGAKEGLERLKEMGYRLVIITARDEAQREGTEDWLAEHLPDIFDEMHFTGAFTHLAPTREEHEGHAAHKAVVSHKKRTKAEVVHQTGALFLIDDSAENAADAAGANPPVQVLLFGDYPWNSVVWPSKSEKGVEELTYVEREERGLQEEFEKKRLKAIEIGWTPDGVERVKDWKEVVNWVKEWEKRRKSL